MSQAKEVTVSCPQCAHAQAFTTWSSINVASHPEKLAELKSGALHRFVCAACGKQTEINYPVLYHHPARRCMVWLQGADDSNDAHGLPTGEVLQGYRLRVVRSRNHLVEKTHLIDLDLDDRIMELYKLIIRANDNRLSTGDLLFAGLGTGQQGVAELQFAIVNESGTQFIGTPQETYAEFASQFIPVVDAEPLEPGQWHRVDEAYASGVIRRNGLGN
ncbi:CpXC domain-containing protein [Synoicihabitans lomoniglobus]|uniref:CpXC domain-containing protein n=1 Tax=Synoicihabitans lomoniglobus TaxID=2909285 RepID=A0AAF0CSI4_9BACT|nr:CpXC domain-containing protein [Opitutaceae bacterium LMO-M01]WED67298.1 CpXC domain-containing protein [Opitutaceae bacterium LMO-M01]